MKFIRIIKGLYTPSEKRACNSAYACRDDKVLVVTKNRTLPGVDPGFSEGGGGGLTTARGNGVCPLPRKAEKFLPLLFVTKN